MHKPLIIVTISGNYIKEFISKYNETPISSIENCDTLKKNIYMRDAKEKRIKIANMEDYKNSMEVYGKSNLLNKICSNNDVIITDYRIYNIEELIDIGNVVILFPSIEECEKYISNCDSEEVTKGMNMIKNVECDNSCLFNRFKLVDLNHELDLSDIDMMESFQNVVNYVIELS